MTKTTDTMENMKQNTISSRTLKEITFNIDGLFCPTSFRKVYDDGSYEWIFPDKPLDGKNWVKEDLRDFIESVVVEYSLYDYRDQFLKYVDDL